MSSWSRWSPFAGANRWTQTPGTPPYYPTDRDQYPAADEYDRERHRSNAHQPSYSHYLPGRAPAPRQQREISRSPPPRQRRPTAHDKDVLILSYRQTLYPVHFEAYTIDDGLLTIGHIRDEAAHILREIPSDRIRMFFKGKKLDHDNVICRDVGFRSKIADRVLVTEASGKPIAMPVSPPEPSRAEEAIEDDSESSENDSKTPASSAVGKKRKSKKKKKKSKGPASTTSSSATSSTLPYPTGGVEYLPMPSGSHPAHRMPSPTPTQQTTPSTTSSSSRTSVPAATATTSNTNAVASPMSKLETIAAVFHETLLPKCQALLSNPPAEKEKRRQEAGRLTLTIEQNVLLKYDGVETEGDEAVRSRRKELIKEAQGWLGRLDKAIEG